MSVASVITGDIVNSTSLPAKEAAGLIRKLESLLKSHKFEFYRGDSFQVYVKDTRLALDITLLARTVAKAYSVDIRASIGIGKSSTPVHKLRTAAGEAFVLSGRAFDSLTEFGRLLIQSYDDKANISLRIIAYYLDHLFLQLTSAQAEVVGELIKGHTQTEIANGLKKAQPTINKLAHAARWPEIENLLDEYQNVITQFKLL